MKADLTFQGIASGLSDGGGPRLQLSTPKGMIREVPLTRRDLTRIIGSAASALELLDRTEARANLP